MVSAYVGYFADEADKRPRPGEDTHIMVGTGNPPVGGVSVILGMSLPSELQLNFDVAGIRCYFTDVASGLAWNVTADPGAVCPKPPIGQLPNGHLNLNQRIVASFHTFEIRCPVVSNASFLGKNLRGYVGTEYGEMALTAPVAVFEPQPPPPPPPPSGRLMVTTNPPGLKKTFEPIEVTIVARDSGNGIPVAGVASIRNFTAAGAPEDFDVPVNKPFTRTFRYTTKRPPDSQDVADFYMPHGYVNCPGYDQDRDHPIPLRLLPPGF